MYVIGLMILMSEHRSLVIVASTRLIDYQTGALLLAPLIRIIKPIT